MRARPGRPALAVEWRFSTGLTALDDDAEADGPIDHFARSAADSLDVTLATVLRRSGLRITADSQFCGVIIVDTTSTKGLEALGL